MIFAAISIKGTVSLIRINGTLNSEKYQELFKESIFSDIKALFPDKRFIWQQDNAPCHVSKSSKKFFKKNKVTLLEWPSNSPDLNPVENIWSLICNKVYKVRKVYKGKEELWNAIQKAWAEITKEELEVLIRSMDNRLEQVIVKLGDVIEY